MHVVTNYMLSLVLVNNYDHLRIYYYDYGMTFVNFIPKIYKYDIAY
jgi:hypothetical protein